MDMAEQNAAASSTNERAMAVITKAMCYSPVLYILVLLLLDSIGVDTKITASHGKLGLTYYLLFIPVAVILLSTRLIKERLWVSFRGRVNSKGSFYSILMTTSVIILSLSDGIGIIGIIFFVITGDLWFSLFLCGLCLVANILTCPGTNEIEDKKAQVNFLNLPDGYSGS
jgi:hypothetical protein